MTYTQLCLICSAIYGSTFTNAGIASGALWLAGAVACAVVESLRLRATPEGNSE